MPQFPLSATAVIFCLRVATALEENGNGYWGTTFWSNYYWIRSERSIISIFRSKNRIILFSSAFSSIDFWVLLSALILLKLSTRLHLLITLRCFDRVLQIFLVQFLGLRLKTLGLAKNLVTIVNFGISIAWISLKTTKLNYLVNKIGLRV